MEGVEYLNIHVGERPNTFGAIISLIALFIVIIGFVALMILLSDDNSSVISILLWSLLEIGTIVLVIWINNSSICNDNYNIYEVKPIEDKYYIDADRFVIEEKDGNIIKVVDKVK